MVPVPPSDQDVDMPIAHEGDIDEPPAQEVQQDVEMHHTARKDTDAMPLSPRVPKPLAPTAWGNHQLR